MQENDLRKGSQNDDLHLIHRLLRHSVPGGAQFKREDMFHLFNDDKSRCDPLF